MAQIQSNRDSNTLRSARDQHTLENLEELEEKKLSSTSNEYECDCPSYSDSEVIHKKVFPKKLSKGSQVSQRNRKKDKLVSRTQSRTKFRPGYDNSHQNVVYSSLCDKPRVLEKSIRTKNTIKNPDTTEIRSVEVIKSFPKSCCSALNRKTENISTKRSGKLQSLRVKKSSDKFSESSLSPLSSPVDERRRVTSDISSIDDVADNQRRKRRTKKSKGFCNCCSCNSLENGFKHLSEQTYRRTVKGNLSQERSHKRQGLFPIDFENRETTHKVKNYQIEKFPDGSSYMIRKLGRMLKSQGSERSLGCTYEKNKSNDDYTMFCKCSESSAQRREVKSDNKLAEYDQKFVAPNNENNDNFSGYSSATKSYSQGLNLETTSPKYWQKFGQDLENISEKYRQISSGLKEMRKEVAENGKPRSREFVKEKKTREYPISKFSFETQTAGDNLDRVRNINNPPRRVIIDTSYHTSSQDNQRIASKIIDEEKSQLSGQESKDQDPTNDVMNLAEKLKMKNQEMVPQSQSEASLMNCQIEFCKCYPQSKERDPADRSTTPIIKNFSIPRESSKERVKRHDFSLPKVVLHESSERSDIRKMFVYPSEEGEEPPLTVYRTSSFVNCKIRENKHVGYRYILTYVQKYVSPTWKPPERNKRKVRSPENVKRDDNG